MIVDFDLISMQREKMLSIAAEIDSSKSRIDAIINGNKVTEDIDSAHVQSLVHTLRVFETKFLVQLKEWNRVSAVVTVNIPCSFSVWCIDECVFVLFVGDCPI